MKRRKQSRRGAMPGAGAPPDEAKGSHGAKPEDSPELDSVPDSDRAHPPIPKFEIIFGGVLLLVLGFWSCNWVLDPRNYFVHDDWGSLLKVRSQTYGQIFNLFPLQVYNDRPVGWMLYKLIEAFAGLNHIAFHAVFVIMHLCNVLMAYAISLKILRTESAAFLCALLFGATYQTQLAVGWTTAIFDLFATGFSLLALLAFQQQGRIWSAVCLLACFLALRTKEFGLFAPILLFAYDATFSQAKFGFLNFAQSAKRTAGPLLLMLVYGARYLYLYVHASYGADLDNPYRQVVNLREFYEGTRFYLGEVFSPMLTFVGIHDAGNAIAILFFAGIACAAIFRRKTMLFAAFGFYVAIGPTLFLKFHRQLLYMYEPMFFLGLFIAGAFADLRFAALRVFKTRGLRFDFAATALFAGLALYSFASPYRTKWAGLSLDRAGDCYQESLFMQRHFPHPESGTTFFISGLPSYFNLFAYGPGDALKVLYGDSTLQCVIDKSRAETHALYEAFAGPKRLLHYSRGRLQIDPLSGDPNP